ncbi:MAG: hypothetical protein ACOCWO_01105 [Candidatus Muiribacteriaceae bacterium]
MSSARLRILFGTALFSILLKLTNLIKILLIARTRGVSSETDSFFLFMGIIMPVYYVLESVLTPAIIPFYKKKTSGRLIRFTGSIMFIITVAGGIYTSASTDSDLIVVFLISCFIIFSSFLKSLFESDRRFVENILIDVLSTCVFIIFLFSGMNIFIILFISEMVRVLFKSGIAILKGVISAEASYDVPEGFMKNLLLITSGTLFSNLVIVIDNTMSARIESGPSVLNYGLLVCSSIFSYINFVITGYSIRYISDADSNDDVTDAVLGDILTNLFFPVTLVCIYVLIYAPDIMDLIFSGNSISERDLQTIYSMTSLSMIYVPVFFLMLLHIRYFNAEKRNFFPAAVALINLVVHIAVLMIFFKSYGVYAVLWARMVSDLLSLFLLIKKDLRIISVLRQKYQNISICLFISAVIYFMRGLPGSQFLNAFVLAATVFWYQKDFYVRFFRTDRQ